MQDEINEKTIALYIKTGKLTAQTLQKAMKTLLAQMKKQKDKTPQGKQTLKQLMKQNAGVSNIEITEGNIKAFESTAKKYGIDFALKKDTTESPPRYLVFFKGRDADVLTAAFKEFSAKKLTQEKKPLYPQAAFLSERKGGGLKRTAGQSKEQGQGGIAMKQEVKKLLILNLPYLLFVYLFDKIGAAIRLTPWRRRKRKTLAAWYRLCRCLFQYRAEPAPRRSAYRRCGGGHYPACRLHERQNAKKYRKGMEYGSARWSA